MIQYIEYAALGLAFVLGIVFTVLLASFGLGLIYMALKKGLTLSDMMEKSFWTLEGREIWQPDVMSVFYRGAHLFAVIVAALCVIFVLFLLGVTIAGAQTAKPNPDEVRQWMARVGSRFDDAVKQDGQVYVIYKGGTFGDVPVSSYVFVFNSPYRAYGVMVTFPGPLKKDECDIAMGELRRAASELSLNKSGRPDKLPSGQEITTYLLPEATLAVTSMISDGGYYPQYIIIWDR